MELEVRSRRSKKKWHYKGLARDEQQHRPQSDLAGLDEKPWCMCVYKYRCVTAHTGARYNTLNSIKDWSPVGV